MGSGPLRRLTNGIRKAPINPVLLEVGSRLAADSALVGD